MTNLLVTGGAGFLGSHFVRSVLADRLPGLEGARVTVLDKLTYAGNFANLGAVAHEKRLDFVPGDVADGPLVDTVLRGVDVIVHFAAETAADRSLNDPGVFATSNVLGTQILLDAALRHGIARFVQVSSDAVYGSLDDPDDAGSIAVARQATPPAGGGAARRTSDATRRAAAAWPAEEAARRPDEAARRADEAARRADEAARRADDAGWPPNEAARRADDEARRADERARRPDEAARPVAGPVGGRGGLATRPATAVADSSTADSASASPDAAAWTESAALAPSSLYGATKAAADLLALAAHRTHGLGVSVVRVCSVYGPHQHPEKSIPGFVVGLLDGRPLRLPGDGTAVRDWLHVDDCGRAIARVLAGGRAGEIYHVGGSLELPERELARLILADLNEPWERVEPIPDPFPRDHRRALDDSKIRRELDWHPRIEFTTGLAGTIHWYRSNPAWWRPLLTF